MSLTSRATSAIAERRGANPLSEWGSSAPPPPGSVGGNVGGLGVSTESAVQIAAVYGAVGLLADSVSSLPLRALDRPSPQVATAEELKLPPLLERPYEEIELTEWLVQFVWALALRGEFLGQVIERDGYGYPRQIMPVSPDQASVRRDRSSGKLEYRFLGTLVPTDDVFHVKYQSLPQMIRGLNPIQVCRLSFGLARAQDTYAAEFFANSANPSVAIEVQGDLSEEETKRLYRRWLAAHQGVHKSHLPAVITGGAKVTPLTITPEDAQFLEQRKFSKEDISGLIFRVPPFMLGMVERSTSFGRGIEQQERTFVTNTLQGYLNRIERSLSPLLPGKQFANFDLTYRLRGDTEQRANAATKLRNAGLINGDEGRAWFDLPPAPDGVGKKFIVLPQAEDLEAVESVLEPEDEPAPEGDPALTK